MDSKTEPASEAKERKFQRLKNSLSALRLELPPEIVNDVIENVIPYVIELREEITRLEAELERERELRKELINDLNDIWENYDHHPLVDEKLEVLLMKTKNFKNGTTAR